MRLTILALIVLLISGCGSGAVVFAPTPPPPDSAPTLYRHPSGAFSVALPSNWGIYEQNTTLLAAAAFAPPVNAARANTASTSPVSFAVINLGEPADTDTFAALIDRYQTTIRGDTGRYTEQTREAMGDGSIRITGLRQIEGGATEQVNTFIQRDEALFGVVDVTMPSDPAAVAQMEAIVNSFTFGTGDALQPAEITALTAAKAAPLGLLHVATWSTDDGVLFITGEIANYGADPIFGVPVEAALRDVDGLTLTGALDVAMGHGIPPGGFAPFSLRFGAQPGAAVDYQLALGGGDWQPAPRALAPADALTWTDESTFDEFGRLVIRGTVTHNGDVVIDAPRAVATVFDAEQRVIAAGWTDVADAIEPGDTLDFAITLPDVGGDPVNYLVNVQGLVSDAP